MNKIFIFFLVLKFFLISSLSLPPCATYLLDFRASLPKNSQSLLPWTNSSSSSVCQWLGVTCYNYSSKDYQVKELNFSYLGLSGVLSRSISHLCLHKKLLSLDLSGNNFTGEIPKLLGSCGKLNTIYLNVNHFTGTIPPEIFLSKNLVTLDLSGNELHGTLSEKIGQCSNLVSISLVKNHLSGQIPPSIGNLTKLKELILSENNLTGSLPRQLGNCTSLVDLELQDNFITGPIPIEIYNLKRLQVLFLNNNSFTGQIPAEVGKLSSLEQIALSSNKLTGRIPYEITNLVKLTYLYLAHNNLTGEVPSNLGEKNVPGLVGVDLTGNKLVGRIPSKVCNGNQLNFLDLGDNQFSASFPSEISKCNSLAELLLHNNLLQGTIPADLNKYSRISILNVRGNFLQGKIPSVFGQWSSLSLFDLSENDFSGSLPPELGNLEKLQRFYVSSNRLSGNIPSELGGCKNLNILDLSNNSLSGIIPPEIRGLPKMEMLLLHENKLNGSIPDSFSSAQHLFDLQLGSNNFQGSIPCGLQKLQQLASLNLSNNRLSGEIPSCLASLQMLVTLDLSNNNLSGEIPSELGNMIPHTSVNISNNHLTGKLPSAWFNWAILNPDNFRGNQGLCLCNNTDRNCEEAKRRGIHGRALAGLLVGIMLSMALLSIFIYILVVRDFTRKNLDEVSFLHKWQSFSDDLPEDLRFQDIVCSTEGWSDKYVIGRGKHGTVYRAEISSTDYKKRWAVKKVSISESNFINETRILSSVRHRNIIKMEGQCVKGEYGFIVTEYIPGGTLFSILHKAEPQIALDWNTRCNIALCIAHGISYLHYDCVPMIIHRDVKSDNILLDSEFVPKIADFGMAKMVSDSDSRSTESVIVGTLGYVAPENAYSARLTEKSDVYSYGVILLELLCRKMPVDPLFEEGQDIVYWVRKNLSKDDECISFLDEEISFWDANEQKKAVRLLDLALECTQQSPHQRPSMREVVGFLTVLKDQYCVEVSIEPTK